MFLDPAEAWQLLSLCTALVVTFLLAVHFTKLKTKVPLFYSWIGAIAIFGGVLAFLLPIALNSGFGKDDDGRVLRQLILYTTGGVLGVITLGESHRKNNQEKEKNENDHTRQVYAERRSRYTKAIEQLADEKATVRLGGIYTLVGLVDEWLTDDTLEVEEQQKEGQVIINNLCSYIRSSFPLARKAEVLDSDIEPTDYEGDFAKDQAVFREEQDVRRSIFDEMSKRSSSFIKDKEDKVVVIPGVWSNFDIDFSRASIFYPLNNLTIEQGNFASARFYDGADFRGAMFAGHAHFRGAEFTEDADFADARFTRGADFRGVMFAGHAHFRGADFTRDVYFGHAKFTRDAYFTDAEFTGNAHFWDAEFTGNAHFRDAEFTRDAYIWGVEFAGDADFRGTKFTGNAHFRDAEFTEDAHFTDARFTRGADFMGAEFVGGADFMGVEFAGDADFRNTEFTGNPHFLDTKFTGNTDFVGVEFAGDADFRNTEFTGNALFGGVKFTEDAYFTDAEFTEDADFRGTKFAGDADFWGVKFTGNAYFMDAKFTRNALFGDTEFAGITDFDRAYFEKCAPIFADASNSARFSAQVDPQDYLFKAHPESPHSFSCGTAKLHNRTFILPLCTVLYDPDSWDEEKQDYTRISEPAL